MSIPYANTKSAIARRFNSNIYQVTYIVNSRGIEPVARAGLAYIYSDAAVERIGSEIARIARDRGVA